MQECFEDAAAFKFGDVDPEIFSGLKGRVNHGGTGVEDHDAGFGDVFEKSRERFEIDGGGLQGRVLGARVFELGDDLDGQLSGGGGFEQLAEDGVSKSVVMKARVEAQGFHAMGLLAAFEVILPAGMEWTKGADGEEKVGGGLGAVGGETSIDGGEILLKQGVVAADPGLGDAVNLQVLGKSG